MQTQQIHLLVCQKINRWTIWIDTPVPSGRAVLRRRSAAARPLRSWVRIPPGGARMFVCCECRVLSGRGLCDELITRPEESYRLWCVIVCDLENLKDEEAMIHAGSQRHKKEKSMYLLPLRSCFLNLKQRTAYTKGEFKNCLLQLIYTTATIKYRYKLTFLRSYLNKKVAAPGLDNRD